MKKVETVVWGVIGAGNVCEIKSSPALSKIPYSRIKTVMSRNAEKVKDFAQRHKISHWTTNLDELLNDPEINAIYIATPPDSHAEFTIKAAQAGKAIYVEKPMANSTEECQLMIDACKKADVPLFVAYYRRALPGFLKVKELIDNGMLGDIRTVNIEMYKPLKDADFNNSGNWRVVPYIVGGGYFHDLASHQLDYLDFLFGEITTAYGISANQEHAYIADDIVNAVFQFENGVIGTGNWCFTTDKIAEKDNITIVGSKGELSFNCFDTPMTINFKSSIAGHSLLIYDHQQPIQEPLIQLIVDELRGIDISPSNGISEARATAIMDKIANSSIK